ncbi:MAG: protein kinase [Candidatus Solibacter sp.]
MRTISHYEILEKLGEGGMGVVWKARDTRLERFVAIKFLPPERTADPDRRRRFMQEARAASALNHARIVTIHEIDQADGADFIVMEFVAGKTLDQFITSKGMKVDETIRIAIQIADALAAAHAAGIVHRDLKPANVMVSETGQIKVLDFGLAKLQEAPVSSGETDKTRTIADFTKTEDGTIVGTTCYMSPEQAEGKKVDARSDIFSFGAVLYEMLTGKRAFQGDSKMSTLAAVLRSQPEPLEKAADGVPRELARIVQRCLRKDPDERAQSMADLRIALKDLKEESESGLLVGVAAPARKTLKRWWIGTGVVALAALGSAAWLAYSGKSAPEAPLQATLLTSYPGLEYSPSFSPDGNQVAFVWTGEYQDNIDIYVKLLGPGKPLRLTTDAASDVAPAWSPDGRWIAFLRGDSLMLVPPIGGMEREVLHAPFVSTAQAGRVRAAAIGWSPDSRWIIASMSDSDAGGLGLFLISAESGEKRRLTNSPDHSSGDFSGAISPDGKTLVFERFTALGSLIMTQGDLFSQQLGSDYSPKGQPARITSDNALNQGATWTADSREIVFSSYRSGFPALFRMPVSGSQKAVRLEAGENGADPVISRDGRRLAFASSTNADTNIWRMNLADPDHTAARLIESTQAEFSPQYSPDGRKIAFSSERSGPSAIWVCDADGGNALQLTNFRASGSPWWSPDGERIAFDNVIEGQWQIFTMSPRGGRPVQLTFGLGHTRPSWSPDGQWIYATGGAGIQKIPARGGNPVQIAGEGNNPVPSPDGKTVYFTNKGAIWRVGADGGSESAVIAAPVSNAPMSVTPDGIYYVGTGGAKAALLFFDFSTGRSRTIHTIGRTGGIGISLSPDHQWLLFTHLDREATGDLMLVDPFR